MKIIKLVTILMFASSILTFCTNDDKLNSDFSNNNSQNQNPDNSIKYIGKYPEKLLFNINPKYSINDYGAYYSIAKKNNRNGVLTIWLVDYNIHSTKKETFFEIVSNNEEGLVKLSGYYEKTDSKGNWIYGDGPVYNVDFSNKGVIKSTENLLHIFYY